MKKDLDYEVDKKVGCESPEGLIEIMKKWLCSKETELFSDDPEMIYGEFISHILCTIEYPYLLTLGRNIEIMNAIGVYQEGWRVMHVGVYGLCDAFEIRSIDEFFMFVEDAFLRYSDWIDYIEKYPENKLPFELQMNLDYICDSGWCVKVLTTGALNTEYGEGDLSGAVAPVPVQYVMRKGYSYYKGYLLVDMPYDRIYGVGGDDKEIWDEMEECSEYDRSRYRIVF